MLELNEHWNHGSGASGTETNVPRAVFDVALRTEVLAEAGLYLLVEGSFGGLQIVQQAAYVNGIFAI